VIASPQTDYGTLDNLRRSFSDSHNHLEQGGWGRQVTIRELPIAKDVAGVNMRLTPGGVRELHWHKSAEWAYMIKGRARITAVAVLSLGPGANDGVCGGGQRAHL